MNPAEPPALPEDDELRARLDARQSRETVHMLGTVILGAGILLVIAVAAMLVVAW